MQTGRRRGNGVIWSYAGGAQSLRQESNPSRRAPTGACGWPCHSRGHPAQTLALQAHGWSSRIVQRFGGRAFSKEPQLEAGAPVEAAPNALGRPRAVFRGEAAPGGRTAGLGPGPICLQNIAGLISAVINPFIVSTIGL